MASSLAITRPDDLRAHLRALGVRAGDHLTVHSRLLSFGLIEGGVATVFNVLREAVGESGTIIAPSYTLARGTIYDPLRTPSEAVGALPEYIRALPEAVRSLCPMHNHVGVGALVDVLRVSKGEMSFGPLSDFEAFLNMDFRLLLLGVGVTEGATFVHHIEALAGVPYRKWMELPRQYVMSDGQVRSVSTHYFGRPDQFKVAENFDVLEAPMIQAGLLTRVPTHYGASRIMELRDLFDFGMAMLKKDPYALVKVG